MYIAKKVVYHLIHLIMLEKKVCILSYLNKYSFLTATGQLLTWEGNAEDNSTCLEESTTTLFPIHNLIHTADYQFTAEPIILSPKENECFTGMGYKHYAILSI